MKRKLAYIGLCGFICLFLIGCSSNKNDIPATSTGQKMYHEIGDAFEFVGPESGLPFEVTVKDVWLESFEEHEDYISEHKHKPTEDERVLLISYKVTNKGDETYEFTDDRFYPNNDVLPNFINPNNMISDIDIAYPNDSVIDQMESVMELSLEPHETMHITGAVIADRQVEYDGAFVWDYEAAIPQIIFTRSQSERKDQVGVYGLETPVYIIDQKEEQYHVTFHNIYDVRSDEDIQHIDREYENSSFLVLDLTIENSGKEDMLIFWAFPQISSNGHERFTSKHFIKKGETTPIKDVYLNHDDTPTDGLIKPGEKMEGTYYYEVKNMRSQEVMTLDARVYYSYRGLIDYPYYRQWIHYNLDSFH